MSKPRSEAGTIQSDETLISILEAVHDSGSAGVTELSDRLNVSKGTVHKHLKTLKQRGYIDRTTDGYSLGMQFFCMGGQVRNRNRLCFMAKDRVDTVACETSEMTKFAIEHDGRGVWMYFSNDHYEMRRDIRVGGRFKLHQNAAGKAILAELSDDRVREILDDVGLDPETDRTVTDREELFAELDEVRDQGWARSVGEFREGGISVAAPVRDSETDTVGALAIAAPSAQTTFEELVDSYGEILQETTRRLELQLRYV